MSSEYAYGRGKEKRVASQLRKKGYKVNISKGSKGAADIVAKRRSKKWVIQVKSSRKAGGAKMSPNERRRLKIKARKKNATPVLAEVIRNKIRYQSIRIKKKLKP